MASIAQRFKEMLQTEQRAHISSAVQAEFSALSAPLWSHNGPVFRSNMGLQ